MEWITRYILVPFTGLLLVLFACPILISLIWEFVIPKKEKEKGGEKDGRKDLCGSDRRTGRCR